MYNVSSRSASSSDHTGGSDQPSSSGEEVQAYEDGAPATIIAPLGGRLVVFESSTEHEVLPAYQQRYADNPYSCTLSYSRVH